MKKSANYLSFILAITLLAGCGSSGQVAAPEESAAGTSEVSEAVEENASEVTEAAEEPAAEEAPETTGTPAEEEEILYDFDPASNYLADIGDYTIEVPVTWLNLEPFYDPCKNDTSRTLYLGATTVYGGITEEDLFGETGDSIISMNKESYEEFEVLEKETVTYSGINMLYEKVHTVADGRSITMYEYVFINPSDSIPLIITFHEGDDKEYSLVGDLEAMLNTLTLKEE